jgi:outer membrane lipoprotein-sorting protein
MLSSSRLKSLALIAATGFLVPGAFASTDAKPSTARTTVYGIHLKSTFGDMGTRKLYVDGEFFRWEYSCAGLDTKLIKNRDGLFLLNNRRKFAGKYPPGDSRESVSALFPGPIGNVGSYLKSRNAKLAGKTVINKKKCMQYDYSAGAEWRCKLWVDAATSTPVQIELNGKTKADHVKGTYTSYRLNSPVPESLFALPKDMKIVDMPRRKVGENKPTEEKKPNAE